MSLETDIRERASVEAVHASATDYRWRLRLTSSTPYAVASGIIVLLMIPVVLMFLTSLKTHKEIFSASPSIIPRHPTLHAYVNVFFHSPIPQYLLNSLIISTATTACVLVLAVPATYGIVHYPYRGAKAVTGMLLATRAIPPIGLLIPFFVLLALLHMINTYQGLILLDVFLGYPLAIWLLKPFFQSFPRDLLSAALVDGCGRMRAFLVVVLPLLRGGIAAVATFVFLWTWNEFLFALVFASSRSVQPVTVGLQYFIGDEFISWGSLAAAAMVTSVPGVVLFAVAQRSIVKGIAAGALK